MRVEIKLVMDIELDAEGKDAPEAVTTKEVNDLLVDYMHGVCCNVAPNMVGAIINNTGFGVKTFNLTFGKPDGLTEISSCTEDAIPG